MFLWSYCFYSNVRVWNFPPCLIVVAASGICVGAAGMAFKCHLKAKSGHPWLTKCRKGDLVGKCHLKAKSGHPWLAKSGQPWLAGRCREDLVVKCQLKPKSGHPWPSERRKGALVVKCHLKARSGPPNVVKATWSSGVI